ncbi:probable serine/threonine-protein kinase PBL19 [Rutidosis leptorrhynchoides]|uniref:probable serine/threonine-protein kinase PBL19 n=1 Tax=Rutidosis leptorrhynchoides TaxID=125765 RepID=UPI003A99AC8F
MDDVHLTTPIGTKGYMDPEIVKTGGVTHKSDIYSFGVVLLEILCGRKAYIPNEDDGSFLVSVAKFEYEKDNVENLIPPSLFDQMGMESARTFTSAAILCVKDDRVQRPDMKYIVHQLEKALELQLPYESLNSSGNVPYLC